MKDMKLLDELWGGIIYNIELDLYLQRALLYIKTQDKNDIKYYELFFDNIFSFNVRYEDTSPWTQVELTEIHYSKNKEFKFQIVMYHEEQMIEVACKKWKLNLIKEYNENS